MRLVRSLAAERASASARRSAPRWPRTCTTPSCRRSRSCRSAPTTRARSPRWPAARSASCARGCAGRRGATHDRLAAALEAVAGRGRARPRRADRGRRRRRRPLDERGEALVAAAREAMVNAAKFGRRLAGLASTPRSIRRRASGLRPRPRRRASTRPPCRTTGAACASRSSAAWSATAGAPPSTRRPATAPRSSSRSRERRDAGRPRRRPRAVPGRRAR